MPFRNYKNEYVYFILRFVLAMAYEVGGGDQMCLFHSHLNITNKSAADMQHTPPGDILNAKKIILKLDLFMQSLKKIGKEMPKIESEKQFITSIKGHNSVLICRNLSICNTKTLLFNINSSTQFEVNAKDRE